MRKTLFLALLLVLSASMVFGAAQQEQRPAGSAAPAQQFRLRVGTVVSPPHPWVDMAEYFAQEVSRRTNGNVQIGIHHSSTLGNDATMIDEMRVGTIDFVIGGAQNAAQFVPEYQVFGLSYLFESQQHFERAIAQNGPIFNRYSQLYDQKNLDLRLLSLSGGGTRNASNNRGPIRSPADMQGVKMRLPGSPIEGRIWSAFGALPTSLPWGEIYSALQAGVVNAFESTISGYYGSKLFEVAPFMSRTEHLYMLSHFSMSKNTYNRLPEEYRRIIVEVAADAGVLGTRKGLEYDEVLMAQMIAQNGLKVNDVDKPAFVRLVAPLHDELAAAVNGTEILGLIRQAR